MFDESTKAIIAIAAGALLFLVVVGAIMMVKKNTEKLGAGATSTIDKAFVEGGMTGTP